MPPQSMSDLANAISVSSGYIDLGMFQDAWDELGLLPPELRAADAVMEQRIEIYHRLGKWKSARILAESLARRCPENPDWWIKWAYSLRREKSVEEARGVLCQAAQIHPSIAMIIYNLACYASVLGDLKEAEQLLNLACSMTPEFGKKAIDDPDLEAIFGMRGGID